MRRWFMASQLSSSTNPFESLCRPEIRSDRIHVL
jgi:hypothetical protein